MNNIYQLTKCQELTDFEKILDDSLNKKSNIREEFE